MHICNIMPAFPSLSLGGTDTWGLHISNYTPEDCTSATTQRQQLPVNHFYSSRTEFANFNSPLCWPFGSTPLCHAGSPPLPPPLQCLDIHSVSGWTVTLLLSPTGLNHLVLFSCPRCGQSASTSLTDKSNKLKTDTITKVAKNQC